LVVTQFYKGYLPDSWIYWYIKFLRHQIMIQRNTDHQ
jgi:hypothetical protein